MQASMLPKAYAPTSNTEEAEVEWFYEDLQDLFEPTPPPRQKKKMDLYKKC